MASIWNPMGRMTKSPGSSQSDQKELFDTMVWGFYHAPVIPARIQSFLWNPADSGGIIFGRAPCQNYHSRDHLFWWNRAIPELVPEWSQNGPERNPAECILLV